ncbi:MAG: UvrD-helicase domain-containing protein [Candidatus Melainabacteria bacterium]|nr:UvrD-helicase domain-containing protein [Candidatus Melainabacteria bacterium]
MVVGTDLEMQTGYTPENELLSKLNPQQVEAVTTGWGPALVIAGAGSGKTTVLTRRIAYLITEMRQEPETVLAVTFTNKAAQQMKTRIEQIVGWQTARKTMIGTFHSICARLLRFDIEDYTTPEGHKLKSNFVIYDETDALSLMKGVISRLNLDDKVFVPREMRYAISALKNDGYTAQLYAQEAKSYRESRMSEIFLAYQADLARNNAMDFDDLILTFTQVLKTCPSVRTRYHQRFRHILVDEFQDTNRSQFDLIRMLAEPAEEVIGQDPWFERTLMVVGDVDQSIYSWRKADYKIMLSFQSDFKPARLIKLEENYRSTATILDVANSIIANNSERIDKVLRCNRDKGGKVQCFEAQDEIDEAYYVIEELKRLTARGRTLKNCVILYRTNAQSRAVEEVLVRNHLPYTVVGGTRFYERQEIKDVLGYLKLIYNPADGQAFNRVVNVPKRGLGKTTIDRLNQYAIDSGISPVQACLEAESIRDIAAKTGKSLREFGEMVNRWHMLSKTIPVSQLLSTLLKETKYLDKLQEDAQSQKDELALGRIENVIELKKVAEDFEKTADEPDLDSFLTRISLVSDLDAVREGEDSVTLMTLHSAKGLEFPVVFLVGLEEGLFPHMRSLDSETAMEEERRLMYVGVTRAEDSLYLTLARKRMILGRGPAGGSGFTSNYTVPSRFLREIAPGLLAGFYPPPAGERRPEIAQDDSFVSGGWGSAPAKSGSYQSGGNSYGNNYGGNSRPTNYGASGNSRPNNYGSGNNYDRAASSFGGNRNAGGSSQPPAKPRAMRVDPNAAAPAKTAHLQQVNAPVSFERLNVGDKVQHAKFGVGTVVQVIGDQDKELYNVEFDEAGRRLLDPRFAKLTKTT